MANLKDLSRNPTRMEGSIELLAPAKDRGTGMVAIDAGADAVYIGPARYGARSSAGNSLADIEQLAAYAHKYWARVYATVNTLLFDDELEPARELCHQLYQAGVDALIIQDMGLLEMDLRSRCPAGHPESSHHYSAAISRPRSSSACRYRHYVAAPRHEPRPTRRPSPHR